MNRATKAAREEAEKSKLSNSGQAIMNPKERLLNFQKRQKLKDLLVTKFMNKYGLKEPEPRLEGEVTKFLQGEKLTDVDLQRFDSKLKRMFQTRRDNQNLKSTLTRTFLEKKNLNKSQPDLLPKIQEQKNPILNSTLNQNQIGTDNQNLNKNYNKIDLTKKNHTKLRPSASVEMINKTKFKYKNPEEELAELEAEFAEEEKAKNAKRNFTRIDFSGAGDEWTAMAAYNKKMFEKQMREEKEKDAEIKRRTKEDLDNQVKQKLIRQYEEELKDKEGDKIFEEHLKYIDELERQKQEALKHTLIFAPGFKP